MRNVTLVKRVKSCNLTAEDLELYDAEPGAEEAAKDISRAIMEHFNNDALSTTEKMSNVYAILKRWSHVGATDSEPLWVVERILRHQRLTVGE